MCVVVYYLALYPMLQYVILFISTCSRVRVQDVKPGALMRHVGCGLWYRFTPWWWVRQTSTRLNYVMTQKCELPPRKRRQQARPKHWQTNRLHGAATDLYGKWSYGLQVPAVRSLPQQKRDHSGHRRPTHGQLDAGGGAVDETVSYTGWMPDRQWAELPRQEATLKPTNSAVGPQCQAAKDSLELWFSRTTEWRFREQDALPRQRMPAWHADDGS